MPRSSVDAEASNLTTSPSLKTPTWPAPGNVRAWALGWVLTSAGFGVIANFATGGWFCGTVVPPPPLFGMARAVPGTAMRRAATAMDLRNIVCLHEVELTMEA